MYYDLYRITLSGVYWQKFHHFLFDKILHTSNVCLAHLRVIYQDLSKDSAILSLISV